MLSRSSHHQPVLCTHGPGSRRHSSLNFCSLAAGPAAPGDKAKGHLSEVRRPHGCGFRDLTIGLYTLLIYITDVLLIYIYILYIYIHIYIYVNVYICKCIYVCIYNHVNIYTHICICTYIYFIYTIIYTYQNILHTYHNNI